MDFRRLTHLVALADERNFRKAAESVHLSQPAFSRSIQAAEAEWGLQLFDRSGPEVVCTPAGAFVITRARRVLQDSLVLARDVTLYRDRMIGELNFGMGSLPSTALLTPLLEDLRKRYPRVRVIVNVNSSHYLLKGVRTEEHEFSVGDVRHVTDGDVFEVRAIGRLPVGFYVRAGHPLLSQQNTLLSHLPRFGIATGRLPREVQANFRKLMGVPASEASPFTLECDDSEVLRAYAQATDAVLFGTAVVVAGDVAAGSLIAISPADLPSAYADLAIVTLRGRTLSPVASYAVDFMTKFLAEQ